MVILGPFRVIEGMLGLCVCKDQEFFDSYNIKMQKTTLKRRTLGIRSKSKRSKGAESGTHSEVTQSKRKRQVKT